MLLVLTASGASAGCTPSDEAAAEPNPVAEGLAELRRLEVAERAAADWATQPPATEVLGADPYRLARYDAGFVGITRGTSRVIQLDADLQPLSEVAAPEGPIGLAVTDAGERPRAWVVGHREPVLARYRSTDEGLQLDGRWRLAEAVALRDVAVTDRAIYLVDEIQDELFWAVRPSPSEEGDPAPELAWQRQPLCAGPIGVDVVGDDLLVDCLIDHRLVLRPLGPDGAPRVGQDQALTHDGPIWSFAARHEDDGTLVLALGGVEDHPLDRSEGFFGHVDSFLFLYRREPGGSPVRHGSLNLSAHGVITPKALTWLSDDELIVTGYGGERAARVRVDEGLAVQQTSAWPPGTNDVARAADGALAAANPLLDAWTLGSVSPTLSPVPGPRAAVEPEAVHLGEVLAFTSLMAPFNASRGAHSRFSCETCHFEGLGDGRTHHTGRGDVHATTKPLFGLFNNRPHFTRALDPDLTRVSHAEFRVAGKGSGHHPWFRLEVADHPWLAGVVTTAPVLEPLELRRSLLRFLMAYAHRPNPRLRDREAFDATEGAGAELFRERCVSCHAARLSTDDPASEVPFEQWETMIFERGAPIVWASEAHQLVGVEPLVHEKGARTTSLRRLERKRPHFTNGSARTLTEVLERAAWDGERFFHDGAPPGSATLDAAEREALEAFLRLL